MKKVLLTASLLGAVLVSAQVGINTENPEATFDVNGNVRVQSTATTAIPSNSDCPCFLVVDENGELKRVSMKQGTGSGIGGGTGGGSGSGGSTSGGSSSGSGVSAVDGGVTNAYVLTPDTVVEMDWSKYKSNQSTVQLSVNLMEGVPYSAYMSPAVELPMVDGTTRKVSLSYPKGVIDSSKKITATLLFDGNQTFMPKLRLTPAEEENYEIPLAFNGLEQTAKLVLHAGVNAVTNTEHGKVFTYPIKKLGKHYVTLINLGAKYAEEATNNPAVLKDWITNSNWATDKKAYGSLFQWQRPADGHELVDWTQSPPSLSQTTTTLSNNPNWIAGHNKFIINQNSERSWVNNTINGNNDTLWRKNGANNPCPNGYHVPNKSEWSSIVSATGGNWWSNTNNAKIVNENLRITNAGSRSHYDGSAYSSRAYLWTTDTGIEYPGILTYYVAYVAGYHGSDSYLHRGDAASVRCAKD